jgi:hypothetical protein
MFLKPIWWVERMAYTYVLVQKIASFGSWDRQDVIPLCHHPGQSQLSRRAMLFDGDSFDIIQILLEIVTLETR